MDVQKLSRLLGRDRGHGEGDGKNMEPGYRGTGVTMVENPEGKGCRSFGEKLDGRRRRKVRKVQEGGAV